MERGDSTLADVRLLVEGSGQPVWTRAVAAPRGERWVLQHLEAIIGPRPPGWRPKGWTYEQVAFVAAEISPEVLGGMLIETPSSAAFGELVLEVPNFSAHVNWTRRASRVEYEPRPLEWPTVDYDLSRAGDSNWRGPESILVSDASPCFPMFSSAFRAFFHGDYSNMATAWSIPSNSTLRVLQYDARIRKAIVTPTHLDVEVDGTGATGCKVEVSGATYRTAKRVGKSGRVRLPLPAGLPDDAWLYLSRGTRWLDYRAIGGRFGFRGDLAKAGVRFEVPMDPEADLEALISTGECATVEFKERTPNDHRSKRSLFKTVSAFANGNGGTILVGVDDDGTPVGVGGEPIETAERRMNDMTRAIVRPTPDFEIRHAEVQGKILLLMHVPPGPEGPYGIQVQHNEPLEFYVRRNASSFPATVSEIRNLARAGLEEAGLAFRARPSWQGLR